LIENGQKWSNRKEDLTKDPHQAALLSIFERKILSYDLKSVNLASANPLYTFASPG